MTSPLPPGMNVTGEIAPDPRRAGFLIASAHLFNGGPETFRRSVNSCSVIVRAYGKPDSRRPSWRSDKARTTVCKSLLHIVELAKGGDRLLTMRLASRDILGDSLSAGRYTFTVSIRFFEPSATTREYPAGALDLRR